MSNQKTKKIKVNTKNEPFTHEIGTYTCSHKIDKFIGVLAFIALIMLSLSVIVYYLSNKDCVPKGYIDPGCSPTESYCHICE